MTQTEVDDHPGFIIGRHCLNNMLYADGTIIMANLERKLKLVLDETVKALVDLVLFFLQLINHSWVI